MNQDFNQEIAWSPNAEIVEKAQLTKFMRQVGASNHDELYQFSIRDVEKFTAEVLKFLDIKFEPNYEKLLDTSNGIQFPKWCVGGGLNITEMCLDRWRNTEIENQAAIIWEGEEGETQTITYSELLEQAELCAAGLRANGFGKGDAIAIHLPMMSETVVALLAINRIGAIAVPVFSGYGADAIASRLNAVGAKALFTCNGFYRRGKIVESTKTALDAVIKCPTIKKIFLIEGLLKSKMVANANARQSKIAELKAQGQNTEINSASSTIGEMNVTFHPPYESVKAEHWAGLLKKGETEKSSSHIEKTAAEDPSIILYTSGTTGKPKGIVHTHCGFPIKSAQDMAFGMDVGRGTRVSWLTDLGWMMGPWLIYGALINGATICLYDGAPDYPNADRMWEFCAKHEVEVFGISPTLIRTLMTHGDELPAKHDLSRLRIFASTGEPWNETPWRWLFETVGKSRVPIINYSGGTEISGGILSGNPLLPIKPMSFSAACLGIDVAILDENGDDVTRGKVGELAIRQPWIGMARGFYQENERYLETYWSRFENIWVHGDFVIQDADGQFYILGRSDDTLKIAGKRVGPAEVETLLVNHELVVEAAVIGVPDDIKGTAMIAFCVVKSNDNANLAEELKSLVAEAMGKPLKPNKVLFVSALPKTRNGKVMRRVIRSAYLGEDAGDLTALENPQSVDEIRDAK